ncbi:MAG TPA: hypothetical protein QF624_00460 [Dehalococcoidia bacterium]|nr:hypothetical protein [Dehalococcoidia bacterium]
MVQANDDDARNEEPAAEPGEEPAAGARNNYGDTDDAPDDEADQEPAEGGGRAAILARVPTLGRPLAIGGGSALLLIWTMLLWQLSGSFSELSASAQTIAHQVEAASTVASEAASGVAAVERADTSSAHAEATVVADLRVNLESTPQPLPTPEPTPEPTPDPSLLLGEPIVTRGLDLWNCSDFETWEQALTVYEANLPNDPNLLDFLNTGVPCQYLRAAD